MSISRKSAGVCCRCFGGLPSPHCLSTTSSTGCGARPVRVGIRPRPCSVGSPSWASSFLSFSSARWPLGRFIGASPPSTINHHYPNTNAIRKRCGTTLAPTDVSVTVEVSSPPEEEEVGGSPSSAPSSHTAPKDGENGEPSALSPSELRDILLRPSPYDSSDDWRDWLRSEEYVDAWASSSSLAAAGGGGDFEEWIGVEDLDFAPLDVSTRYLLELLDDAAEGVRRGMDRATTKRCNRAIERLSDKSIGGEKLVGRAQRADAILRRMQRCERVHRQHSRGGGDPLRHELPLPDKRTYYSVLQLYAAESGPKELALRAEAVAEEMVEKFGIRSKAAVWNQALSCWAVSTEPEKSIHAASLLGKMKESAGEMDNAVADGDGKEKNDIDEEEERPCSMLDTSSYGHVLRACALSGSDGDNQSRKLGAEVALRVWGDYKKSGLPITSYGVTFLLRAAGNLPRGDPRGAQTVGAAFQRCCEKGLVNAYVLHQLDKAVESLSLEGEQLKRIVGKVLASNLKKGLPGIALLRKVPTKWTVNASSKTR